MHWEITVEDSDSDFYTLEFYGTGYVTFSETAVKDNPTVQSLALNAHWMELIYINVHP